MLWPTWPGLSIWPADRAAVDGMEMPAQRLARRYWLCLLGLGPWVRSDAAAAELIVGVEGTYPPFNFQGGDGTLQGYEVEFGRALAARMGRQLRFVTLPWASLLAALPAHRVDLVINHLMPTPERRRRLDFSHPYTVSGIVVLTRPDLSGKIHGMADLAGRRVGAAMGSYYEQWLRTQQPKAIVVLYPSLELGLRDLEIGRFDAIVNDELVAADLLRKGLQLRIVAPPSTRDLESAVAMARNRPQLLQQVDAAIDAIRADGTLRELSLRWFGRDTTP